MVYELELEQINRALESLMGRLTEGQAGDVDLSNAIDHLGVARELLGGEDLPGRSLPTGWEHTSDCARRVLDSAECTCPAQYSTRYQEEEG